MLPHGVVGDNIVLPVYTYVRGWGTEMAQFVVTLYIRCRVHIRALHLGKPADQSSQQTSSYNYLSSSAHPLSILRLQPLNYVLEVFVP